MPDGNILKYGVLKTRDLVELYFGARMVTSVVESSFSASATPYQVLGQDPRRIKYEIWFNFMNVAAATPISVGTPAAIDAGKAAQFSSFNQPPGPLMRDFFTDGDSVCLAQVVSDPSGVVIVSTRETFLTPAPVDEVPLG